MVKEPPRIKKEATEEVKPKEIAGKAIEAQNSSGGDAGSNASTSPPPSASSDDLMKEAVQLLK